MSITFPCPHEKNDDTRHPTNPLDVRPRPKSCGNSLTRVRATVAKRLQAVVHVSRAPLDVCRAHSRNAGRLPLLVGLQGARRQREAARRPVFWVLPGNLFGPESFGGVRPSYGGVWAVNGASGYMI